MFCILSLQWCNIKMEEEEDSFVMHVFFLPPAGWLSLQEEKRPIPLHRHPFYFKEGKIVGKKHRIVFEFLRAREFQLAPPAYSELR